MEQISGQVRIVRMRACFFQYRWQHANGMTADNSYHSCRVIVHVVIGNNNETATTALADLRPSTEQAEIMKRSGCNAKYAAHVQLQLLDELMPCMKSETNRRVTVQWRQHLSQAQHALAAHCRLCRVP